MSCNFIFGCYGTYLRRNYFDMAVITNTVYIYYIITKRRMRAATKIFFSAVRGFFPKIWGHPTHSIGSTHTTLFPFR